GPPEIFGPRSDDIAESGDYNSFDGPLVNIAEGMTIRQYELVRELGRGGMGVVFLARDTKLGRRVAIKFMQVRHPELTRRFIKEAQVTARCMHENIVVIHEAGEYEGAPFMVLEYVEGEALSVMRGKAQPMTRVVEIIAAVVRALARAHDEGIVHRDLKPENVLLGSAGTIKVLDFGIAKLLEHAPAGPSGPVSLNQTLLNRGGGGGQKTGIIGTIDYMSPEQWGAFPEIDHRTDIWSVGVMLYEFLSGTHPLAGRDRLGMWVMQLDAPVPSLGKVARDLPPELIRVVDTCLNKHPDQRYANARDLLKALEPFLPGRYQAGLAKTETGPYAGLRTFQEEDAGRFFGRNTERAELLARLRDTALLAVVGPSGVGKSSFIRAGVIPALKSAEGWDVFTIRPGRHPMQALAELCVQLLDPRTGEAAHPGIENIIRSKLIVEPGVFGNLIREYCRRQQKRLLLLVDQFEELYTLSPHHLERKALTSCLCAAADDITSPARVIITIRADFLGRVAEDAQFMNEMRKGLFFLGPPSMEGLREALVQPAEAVGYRFETEAMINEMVRFLEASPNGLPLLQFAASQLWEARDPVKRLLTDLSYRGIGGVAGALVSHADRVISVLSTEQQTLCRRLFSHLVTPERTRAIRSLTELKELLGEGADLKDLIDELVDSRLLVVQTHSNDAAVEIVHESLIITWPTLRRWLDASHEDSLFLDQLLAAANQWNQNNKAPGLLWSGEMVSELHRFQRRYQGKLPLVAEAFAAAIDRQAISRTRLKRGLAVGGVLTAAGLLAAAAVALVVISGARATAVANEQRAIASQAAAQKELAERVAAEKRTVKAQERTVQAEGEVEKKNKQLLAKNRDLEEAVKQAEALRIRAEEAQKTAEQNAKYADAAKKEAEQARKQEEKLRLEAELRAKNAEKLGMIAQDLAR
ncbi:MAG TPA: protein kinase, partial [Polyangiaceae bacterium]|nr:protein kinase [Polyangiaceae bacterium]